MRLPRPWVFRYAVRDTRGVRGQLAIFMLSMVLGIAALVAINAIGDNLTDAADEQAKALLGADFRLSSRNAFSTDAEVLIDSLGGEQARLYSFASMALATTSNRTRLVSVRATDPGYPFYGEVLTDPADAAIDYLRIGGTIVDPTVLTQLGVSVGDTIRVGRNAYPVLGVIVQTSRETSAMSAISPRIYLPRAEVDSLLLTYGSRVDYEVYFRFRDGRDADALGRGLRSSLRELGLRYSSVEKEKREWNEALTNLYKFLSLVAFVALLLGGLGVASSMHVYIKRRLSSVAVLRCIGAPPSETTAVYIVQALLLGLFGSAVGSSLGILVQQLVPGIINAVSPLTVQPTFSLRAIVLGMVVGTGVSVLFAALPILGISRTSPLLVFRKEVSPQESENTRGRVAVVAAAVIGLAIVAMWQAPTPVVGLIYMLGLVVVFGLLRLVAKLLGRLARTFRLSNVPFEVRQGISSLFRPGNQTALLTVAIGFVAFMIFLLSGLRTTLLSQVSISGDDGRPNLILFDIQPDQVQGVGSLISDAGHPVIESVPIVSMRIRAINGRTIRDLRNDDGEDVGWAHRREYRSSYRDELNDSEELTAGALPDPLSPDFDPETGTVPITIASDLESELGVSVGDSLRFDVQGLSVNTVIVGVRTVNWSQLRTNFYFLFPSGILEDAPATYVVVTQIADATQLSAMQASVVSGYPNVSAIDLTLVLAVIESVFGKIATVIRFLALFCVATGILVLIGAITSGQTARTEESVLLKTLGASRDSIQYILAVEYALIGLIATLSGMALGGTAAWLLARFSFKVPTNLPILEYAGFLVAIVAVTVGVGMVLSRSVYRQSPLAVLRNEM